MFALFALSASAHEALEEPIARYETDGFSDNKSCPCGVGNNDQLCSQPDRSDEDRSADRITTYDAGETITVRLHEVVGHEGRWRIAFDADGADQDDFNATILLDEADPAGSAGNTGKGDLWEWQVTLPQVPCDTCTLQVIQVMNGDTVNPVPDPTGQSTYYQCADLVLLATGTTPTTTTTTGGTGTPGTTDTAPPPYTDPPPTDSTPTGTPTPTTPTSPDGTPDADSGAVAKGGCGCAYGGGAGAGAVLVALALAAGRRRRL